ncbi:diguanylate cyclase [Aureimonas glaciei]|uniref:diguanylate cyclase n=1 Tax=Aureimonas glaciei TaxID=1776957 RepID=A0A916V166_9HYPH|nr:diguanylate cyclase [Aureimonas glaciei]GGD01566.1 GGDEF domain-containing protein [Aureimonas glaciei]
MNIVVAMINGLGQLALVAVFFGMVQRLDCRPGVRACLLGVIFGLGAIFAMMTPSPVKPGVLIDARAVVIGLSAAFVGLPAVLISGAMAAVYRLWIGGSGTPYGLMAIALAGIAGLAWRRFVPPERQETVPSLLLLAVMIACHSVVVLHPTGDGLPDGFLAVYFPSIWATCLAGTLTLGWMMRREIGMIHRERSLRGDALVDPLTGLGNRRAVDHWLDVNGFRRGAGEFSVILVDIDHFKSVNDRFGHHVGDAVLQRLGAVMRQSVRDVDLVARYGGEEFLILLPAADAARAQTIAERIRQAIAAEQVSADGVAVRVSASFGIADSWGHDDRVELVAAADAALYRAKRNGRDRVEVAPPREARVPFARQSGPEADQAGRSSPAEAAAR